jgi:solute carrier family 35 protein F1/2
VDQISTDPTIELLLPPRQRHDPRKPSTMAAASIHDSKSGSEEPVAEPVAATPLANARRELFAYMRTSRFYLVLLIGQILSLCITGTNTFSGLLAAKGNSIPAMQSWFNYVLLNLVYTSYTLYSYGPRGYWELLKTRGWKYFILAFLDVEGNYFVILAYRYTTVISAQLINFWAIVVVVIISFLFLRVRYHWTQVIGILICCGGMGVLISRDAANGSSVSSGIPTELKGDLFMLLGASIYGLTNVAEEFLVSQAPLYEVVGQIGFWGMLIAGAQTGIFDRDAWHSSVWNSEIGGYETGFTLVMFIFYSTVPILLRLASAAFFNISLLTSNFYGVAIGIRVFGYHLDRFYPLAFVMIIVGLVIYFAFISVFGEAKKPWLGENQEGGVVGVGTAKKMVMTEAGAQPQGVEAV